jgi:transcriptional regulator with XRE-family HTH domain
VETFAARLKHARQLRHLSQGQLARACGLSQSTISSYENGMRKESTHLLCIAQALEVNAYWLSRGQGPMCGPSGTALTLAEGGWPFPSIEPRQFWSLSQQDRQVVEHAIAALIASLQGKPRPHQG